MWRCVVALQLLIGGSLGHNHDLLKDLGAANMDLRQHIPEVLAGFSQMHKAALGDGTLDAATKELIALAISISSECDGCIASHARGAVRKGASPEAVAETIGVAIMMTGGPGTVYGPRAWDAYKEFAEG